MADTKKRSPFRWLVRAAIVALVGSLVGWFGWDVYARRQFKAEVARLQAMGQLVTVEDYNGRAKIPDAQNAATLYRQAFVFTYSPAQEAIENECDFSYQLTDAQKAALRTFPASFATNLRLAREARTRNRCDFYEVVTSPMIKRLEPRLNDVRGLANLIKYTAEAQRLDGHYGDASESVRDILHLSAMFDQADNAVVEHLVALGISALGSSEAMELSRDLPIGPAPAASREQVRGLIDDLLADLLDRGLGESLKAEQASGFDSANFVMDSAVEQNPLSRWMRPAFYLGAVRWSQFISARIADFDPESASATLRNWDNLPPSNLPDRRLFNDLLLPALRNPVQTHFRIKLERRAAAIMLAARLYRLDHADQWPPSLESLVPAYLPKVPRDVFAGAPQPMRYVRSMVVDGVETPVVYSVGKDGVDQNGSPKPENRTAERNRVWESAWDREDAVYPFLRPPLPLPEPKPQE